MSLRQTSKSIFGSCDLWPPDPQSWPFHAIALTACNINKIESCQRWFTKRIKGLCGLDYSQRLEHIGLETLELRRIKYDLLMCYNIISGEYLKTFIRLVMQILKHFVSRNVDISSKAFTTYVRPILEYCTPVWSPHTACNINKISHVNGGLLSVLKVCVD